MFPKKRRMDSDEVGRVFRYGARVFGKNLQLVFLKEQKPFPSKFSFSIPNKAVNSAVERNYLKRLGFNLIKNYKDDIKPSFLCVFILKKGRDFFNKEIFRTEMEQLMEKAEVINH